MGSPISSIITEIFLQHIEDLHIKQLLDTKNHLQYTRYIDDILIIYDTKRIHPKSINSHINQIHNNIKHNPTYENNNCIIFLDLSITPAQTSLETDIFRKPTTTEKTINFLSNCPMHHKMAANRYHFTRMHSLPLTPNKNKKSGQQYN